MTTPPPPPMPSIEPAMLSVKDLRVAAERATQAWNRSQLTDALRSVRYFLDKAEREALIK